MKNPYLLVITAILCLVLTGGMSLAKDSDVEAIGSYTQALRINPDDADAHTNLGIAYGNLGMYNKAIGSYTQAIGINPDDAKAHYNLGVTYGNLDMYNKAIGSYTQAIRINPDDAKVHYNLGIAYVNSGMDKKAIESYKQAIRINPDDAKAHFKLGLDAAFDDKGPVLEQYKILKSLDSELANKLFNFIYE